VYAYYYYNNPEFLRTNITLRLAVAPAYLDGEIGFRNVISPTTDFGIGINGGLFAYDYYEVVRGDYNKGQSFNGNGGGTSVSLYQLLDPGMLIPLSLVARAGYRSAFFMDALKTDDNFTPPANLNIPFVRAGFRLAGKEPVLYPELGLELSVWFQRQWNLGHGSYGFNDDRHIEPDANLYWAYGSLNYAWTNIGHQVSFAAMAAGSDGADRLSAWRLGGVLPLVSEFPLVLPGYYYQELTAKRFVYLYGGYLIPLDAAHRFQFRVEAASARLDYLEGFEQNDAWQTGTGAALVYTSPHKVLKVALRYGYGFQALRDGEKGAHSVGILFEYDFEARKRKRAERE
jgi:hypothetical protein